MKNACRKITLLVLLAAVWATPSFAQYTATPPDVESPYWWTLTDQLAPQELRDALQSREKSQERLRDAVRRGLYSAAALNRVNEISLFIDGGQTPELFPMWEVFHAYSHNFDGSPANYEEKARRVLANAGVSTPGVSQIIAIANQNWREEERAGESVRDPQRRFVREVLIPMDHVVGEKSRQRALLAKDFQEMSRVSGHGRSEIADLYDAWSTDVAAEASTESIVQLRAVLSDEDWNAFRDYLLIEIATRRSIDYYSERPLR